MRLRQKIESFFRNRYGMDKLGMAFVWCSLILMIVNIFVNSFIVYLLQLSCLIYWLFRSFSRNINKRYRENQKFEKLLNKFTSFFKLRRQKWVDRKTHVFTKCPYCKVTLRLPRKKGDHRVNCPKCQKTFSFKCK